MALAVGASHRHHHDHNQMAVMSIDPRLCSISCALPHAALSDLGRTCRCPAAAAGRCSRDSAAPLAAHSLVLHLQEQCDCKTFPPCVQRTEAASWHCFNAADDRLAIQVITESSDAFVDHNRMWLRNRVEAEIVTLRIVVDEDFVHRGAFWHRIPVLRQVRRQNWRSPLEGVGVFLGL